MGAGDDSFTSNVQKNDVVMDSSTGTRFLVQSGGFATGSPVKLYLLSLTERL
jgi:hypothetical protein